MALNVRTLRREPEGQTFGRVVGCQTAACFHWLTAGAMTTKPFTDDKICLSKRGIRITGSNMLMIKNVVSPFLIEARGFRLQRFFWIEHNRKWVVVDIHQFKSIFERVFVASHNGDNRVSHILHLATSQWPIDGTFSFPW